MIVNVEDYFIKGCGRCDRFATPSCSTRRWIEGLDALRRICRDLGMTETVKWGHPCYVWKDRNIALIGAFQGDFRLTFMNAALLKDPAGLLEKPGPNSLANMLRFTDNARVAEIEARIRTFLAESIGYADAGIEPPKVSREYDFQDELVEALESDAELAEAFHRLTPGRQRSYVIFLSSAKTSETRRARVAKSRARIIAGKGANER